MFLNSVITGTGSFLPKRRVPNSAFLTNTFYDKRGNRIDKDNAAIVQKLESISGIKERRYAKDKDSAQMAAASAEEAIKSAGIDRNTLDGIIIAHNFGNIAPEATQGILVPNVAALVKHHLGITNPTCVAFDVLFGCPGWLHCLLLAHLYIQARQGRNYLVIGVESISGIIDPHDMDGMLFGDGAGSIIIQAEESEVKRGILSTATYSHCQGEVEYLKMGPSNNPDLKRDPNIKMQGRGVYRYAVSNLPPLVSQCLEKANVKLEEITKFLFHQANEKMIKAIASKLFKQHGLEMTDENLLPISVHLFGNSSVATIPTLMDLIMKGEMPPHSLGEGDLVVMASVGAGMHSNAMVYKY